MTDDFISASEIGEFVYCQRAWWYRKRGFKSSQQEVMQAGTEEHEILAKQVGTTVQFRQWAWRFVLLGVALLVLLVALRLLTS